MAMQAPVGRRATLATMVGVAAGVSAVGRPAWSAEAGDDEDLWASLIADIFPGKPTMRDGGEVIAIDAPYRAEDAAVVPITLRLLQPASGAPQVRRLTVVIDQNPSPLVAVVELGPDGGTSQISTAVRVNSYTNIHVVAETGDSALFVVKRFVKAAGGCSAPALNASTEGIPLGTLRFRQFPAASAAADAGFAPRPEAQIMVRHPNFSGMQMDQLTHLYIPARFVQALRVWQGDALVLGVTGGISLSENPQLRFDYRPNGAKTFRAEVVDSVGKTFAGEWPANPGA